MLIPAMMCSDAYKWSHRVQYPAGTEEVYSTWTPRTSRLGTNYAIAFGLQGFIREYLMEYFNDNFFSKSIEDICEEYSRVAKNYLGDSKPEVQHIRDLHALGYLPLEIKSVPEGTLVPIRCPMSTIRNTDKRFPWLTNYIETLWSACLWQPSTSATIANEYRKVLDFWADYTKSPMDFVPFQGHDFSFRGMSSVQSAAVSGAGHLTSFVGTDTIPGIMYLEQYYKADIEKELVGCSIPATEHSVMCVHGLDEMATYKHMITKVYPAGFVSIVSDTWDLWKVLDVVIRGLKPEILARDGKVVIRPDSGDPVKIICGDPESKDELVRKGVIEILWDIFGGTKTSRDFRLLDQHIGCIYGDAITLDRADKICRNLAKKGFASANIVFGIGSYTYQFNTRDTLGFAVKATHCIVDGKDIDIYKKPVTDDGTKNSACGRVQVLRKSDGIIYFTENCSAEENPEDLLQTIFKDGRLVRETSLSEVRALIRSQDERKYN